MDHLLYALPVGACATAMIDLWAIARRRLFGIALPDYGLVGRWLAHMRSGRFRHVSIKAAPSVRGEHAIGWIAHYFIGVAFAALLLAVSGTEWLRHPALAPALFVGIATVAMPFLLMQPGMGAGIAASRTPHPAAARLHSLVTHAMFGLGLYGGWWITRALCAP